MTDDPFVGATSAALAGIGLLHVGWGLRVPMPGVDGARVADAVVGSDEMPSPAACFAVAAALAAAALLVAGVPSRWPRLRRVGQIGVAVVLGGRALLGADRSHRPGGAGSHVGAVPQVGPGAVLAAVRGARRGRHPRRHSQPLVSLTR